LADFASSADAHYSKTSQVLRSLEERAQQSGQQLEEVLTRMNSLSIYISRAFDGDTQVDLPSVASTEGTMRLGINCSDNVNNIYATYRAAVF
jgi:hypothetical protein